MEKLKKIIFETEEFTGLSDLVRKKEPGKAITVKGVAGSLMAFVSAKLFQQGPVVLISGEEDTAEKLYDDCKQLLGKQSVFLYGSPQKHQHLEVESAVTATHIETLKKLSGHERSLIIASPEALAEKIPSPDSFERAVIELQSNSEHDFKNLIETLQSSGFERKDFVEGFGDFAVRGGILDVFSYAGENPVRLEFWGNTIESIREFDVLSQRSIRTLKSVSIVPSFRVHESDSSKPAYNLTATFFDYLDKDTIIIFDELPAIERESNRLLTERTENILTFEEMRKQADRFKVINHSMINAEQQQVDIDFHSKPQPPVNASINRLAEQIQKFNSEKFNIILTSNTKDEASRLKELVNDIIQPAQEQIEEEPEDQNEIPINFSIEYLPQNVHSGFIFPSAKLALFTEHEIFGRIRQRSTLAKNRFKGFSPKELHQLKRGDFVVHRDYGIGTFAGLKKITVGQTEQEVLKLLFLENDVLYVNLNFIDRVQKYSSQEGTSPALHKLGSADWERTKAKAKRRIKDIARELIALYAKRKHEQGFAFAQDTHWQKELEASFIYEDTPDQATATLDVKRDMEDESPMDRLICGDVGFGKTEIAVRAAFKAVMAGKQVALLVPTTVLALQHYRTFQDRLSRYSTRIENITRFKSTKEQKIIVEQLKQGSVDIIIGTHRLLSKDIAFKDLGLLIIDEEHRFGVSAKEKLRQLKVSVDTLTLTATPIPRTLHFSLMGARDLSIINTPPRNRIPIVTEIIAADSSGKRKQWKIIHEAIMRELYRGGQIYIVHDRVQTIDAFTNEIRSHIPEAQIHSAHGQMPGHELEKTMLNFLEKKYDILVCTKIIESGLDIPNVNTILINRADTFGLAELYQLRGRVGRSNVQAYAYLLTPPFSVLPKATMRRLQAIQEFTELGSGFNLAMRDMEIRGTGNLLGAEQSGFILEVGFEMYERIVNEAVGELKNEEFQHILKPTSGDVRQNIFNECAVEADVDALIPDFYVESDAERLDIYRRLYRSSQPEELQSIREELVDRFGEYPEEMENLFGIIDLRLVAAKTGFVKISLQGKLMIVTLPPETDEQFYGKSGDSASPFQSLIRYIASGKKGVQLKQENKNLTLHIPLQNVTEKNENLLRAKSKLEELASEMTLENKTS